MPLLVALALLAPGTALASKGGGGGASSDRPYADRRGCDWALDGPSPDGQGQIFSNQVNAAGCLRVILANDSSSLRLYSVQVSTGWTYAVKKKGEGTDSTVLVDFSNRATGEKAQALRRSCGVTKVVSSRPPGESA